MNIKTFIVAGLIGGFIDWLLGWLFYGYLFADVFPEPMESTTALVCITVGCFASGFFISYIYNKWAQIKTFGYGAKGGAIIGLFISLIINSFKLAEQSVLNYEQSLTDIGISVVLTAIVGGIVGLVNGKVK